MQCSARHAHTLTLSLSLSVPLLVAREDGGRLYYDLLLNIDSYAAR